MRLNPMNLTPNLDRMAAHGVLLAGRTTYQQVTQQLRRLERMKEAGDEPATIEPTWFPYS